MDTMNNDAAFWIAGYTDYLRDVVGAADTTRLRYLPTVQGRKAHPCENVR